MYVNGSFFDSGGWDDSGCETSTPNPKEAYCKCNHMTNFAILVSHYRPVSYPLVQYSHGGGGPFDFICKYVC